jgi:hypothetical protein
MADSAQVGRKDMAIVHVGNKLACRL